MWCVRARLGAPATLRIARPERVDFEARERYDTPSWPVDFEEVDTYLDQALEFFELPNATFWPSQEVGQYPLDPGYFVPKYFYFPEARVVHENRLHAARSSNTIDLRTGWTLLDIKTDRSRSKVTRLTFENMQGKRYETAPKHVVLATGGVENARILLHAVDEGQLPNPHDTLGRWFMDHPHCRLGVLIPDDDIVEAGRFHDFHERDGHLVLGHYALSPQATRSEDLLRFSMTLVGAPSVTASKAAAAGARLAHSRYDKLTLHEIAMQVAELAKDGRSTIQQLRFKLGSGPRHHTALGGWSNPETAATEVGVLAIESMVGQRPSPDNRIRLGRGRNRCGKRRPTLQWSWSQPEVDSYWRSVELAREQFESSKAGTFTGARDLGSGRVPRGGTGWHQMGGTRMAYDPAAGVVDPNCRHHQTENLFIAGSSVFPSSIGYANPTLTLVALALRLGDHLG